MSKIMRLLSAVMIAGLVLGAFSPMRSLAQLNQAAAEKPAAAEKAAAPAPESSAPQGGGTVHVGQPVSAASSPAARDLPRKPSTDLGTIANREKNPLLWNGPTNQTFESTQQGKDPLVAKGVSGLLTPDPIFSFEGLGTDGYTPPDNNGDVGPNHYVEMVNVSFAVYDKSGNVLLPDTLFTDLFAGSGLTACETENDGDPIVLYDQQADRWLLSQFAVESGNRMCVAISQTADPTGAYWLYQFEMPDFPDYFKFGVWPDAYYMSTNTGYPNQYYAYAFDRAAMLNGETATYQYFDGYPNFMMPADIDGANPPPLGSPGYFYTMLAEGYPDHPAGVDRLAIYEFHVDWANPANSTYTLVNEIPVADFNYTVCGFFVGSCIPQPGTSQGLDSLSWWPMFRFAYRNFLTHEAAVGTFTVDLDGTDKAAPRWFELRKTGDAPWALYQEGTYAPDSDHRWMGSIAMDGSGNIALGYSVSSSTTMPAIRYAIHGANDTPGTMQAEATLYTSAGVHTGIHRWGDYTAMSVDPTDNCTFWYVNQYDIADNSGWEWHTRIGAFKAPNCTGGLGPTGTVTGLVTDSSNSDPIPGALVAMSNITSTLETTANASGVYTQVVPVAAYTMTFSAFGYYPTTIANVDVVSGTVQTVDAALDPKPHAVVSGVVADANTGWPLYARLSVTGVPGEYWTDPVTGFYSISLPVDTTYEFIVESWVAGYLPARVTVGPVAGDTTQNFDLAADTASCNAPGYAFSAPTSVFASNFEANKGGFAAGGTNSTWAWGAPTSGPGAAHSGSNVWATNLGGDYNDEENSYIVSSPIDLSAHTGKSVLVDWWQWLQTEDGWDYAWVEVTNDGGASWTTVYGDVTGDVDLAWAEHQAILDLSYAVADFQVRYVLSSDTSVTSPGYYVDDVNVSVLTCDPGVGGLVVGNVYDANTALPLNGALVSNEDGYSALAVKTPDDPDVNDGLYTLFSPAGGKQFQASANEYATVSTTFTVTLAETTRQDFSLPAGIFSFTPAAIDQTVAMGGAVTVSANLENTGSAEASFEFLELKSGFVQMGPFQTAEKLVRPWRTNYRDTKGIGVPRPLPEAPQLAAGEIVQNWPTGLYIGWGLGYNLSAGDLWIGDIAAGGGTDLAYGYLPDGTSTGDTFDISWAGAWAADMTYNPNTGTLWVLDVGGDNCIHEVDPATQTVTGNTICPNFGVSQRGLAYDPATDTYFAGGWNDGMIHRFAPDGTSLADVNVGLDIAGLAYNPDTQHLFVMVNASPNPVYVLDVANGYNLVGQFTIPGFTDYGGAGFEMDCDGRLWAVDQTSQTVYQVESGETTSVCGSDVPWLSESPITGTVMANNVQAVDVVLDAGVPEVTQPGVYFATLKVKENTPYAAIYVPVTMTVQAPAAWGKLEGTVTGLGYCDADPAPLKDALITVEGADGFTKTLTTLEDGSYQWWLDEVHSPLTVTVAAIDHQVGSATGVLVVAAQTTLVDFNLRWLKPCISAAPTSMDVTVAMGYSTTVPMQLNNNGAAATAFEFTERETAQKPLVIGKVGQPFTGVAPADQSNRTTQGLSLPAHPAAPQLAAGEVVQTWASGLSMGWGLGYDLAAGDLWIGDPAGWGGSGQAYRYLLDGANTGDAVDFSAMYSFADMAYNPNTGTMWVVNVGDDNCIYEFDPATNTVTGNKICPDFGGLSQRGLAYDPATDTYFAGNWSDGVIHRFTPDGTLLDSVSAGLYVAGLAYNPDTQHLFVMENNAPNPVYVLDVANGYSVVGQFTIPGFTDYGGAGLEMDCDGRLWALDQASQTVYQVESDETTSFCNTDVPWVSESPITGTLLADNFQPVNVTFDASMVEQPGIYQAAIKVTSDDPVTKLQVPVTMTVTPPATWGLLKGVVTSLGYCDANPAPLEDALITVEGADGFTKTLATLEDGSYQWWLDESYSPLTVTVKAFNHQGGSATGVVIVGGQPTTTDFSLRWLEPCVSVAPTSMDVEVVIGYSTTLSLQLSNSGAAAATFEFSEKETGQNPFVFGKVGQPFTGVAPADQANRTTQGLSLPAHPAAPQLAAGEVVQTWASGLSMGWGLSYDLSAEDLWLGDPGAWGGTGQAYRYLPDGTATADAVDFSWMYAFADMAYNPNTGMMWVVNVGDDDCIYEFDPMSVTATGNAICPAFGISQRGLAYDPVTDTYFAGSWNDGVIHRFAPDGVLLDSVSVGLYVAGLAYNPDTQHLFVIENNAPNPVYVLDVADGYNVIGQFTISGFSDYGGAGLDMDCDGRLWALDQASQTVYQVESDETTSFCNTDVPWLSESPITGTIAAGGFQAVDVTFDASVPEVMYLGQYLGVLTVRSDDPLVPRYALPVTMTVVAPDYNVSVDPLAAVQLGDPGATVVYTLTVANRGNAPDTFDVIFGGNAWNTTVPEVVGPLAPGEKQTIEFSVDIPDDAQGSAYDVVVVEVVSRSDPMETANASFVTVANGMYAVDMDPMLDLGFALPDEWITYHLTVTNTGTTPDTYDIAVDSLWVVQAQPVVGVLNPGESASFDVKVQVPADALDGEEDVAMVAVTSQSDASRDALALLISAALPVYGVWVDPINMTQADDPGATVVYTLTVANLGNTPDTFDVVLGGSAWNTTGPETVGPLDPGQEQAVEFSVNIPADAQGGASDTASVQVVSQSDAMATADASLVTVANGMHAVALAPASQSGSVLPGEWITYRLIVTNTGTTLDTYNIAVNATWAAQVQPVTSALNPGAGVSFTVKVQAPANALDGATDTATVTVTSQSDANRKAAATLVTTVLPVYGASVDPNVVTQSDDPGMTLVYSLTVTNDGNAADAFDVTVLGSEWATNAPAEVGPLAPGAAQTVVITVAIPSDAIAGAYDQIVVNFTSQSDAAAATHATLVSIAKGAFSLSLTPESQSDHGLGGRWVEYILTVTNTSNTVEDFAIAVNGVWASQSPATVGALAVGASTTFTVRIQVPAGASNGDADVAIVTVTSQSDPTQGASVTLSTFWQASSLYLPLMIR